jgi:hypothetical protein
MEGRVFRPGQDSGLFETDAILKRLYALRGRRS